MKSDLDPLMEKRGLDAFVVSGGMVDNYPLRYMTGYARISEGFLVKKRGGEAHLVCVSMEREEAARSGLAVATYHDFHKIDLINQTGSVFEGTLRMRADILRAYGITGAVAFYGKEDPGLAYQMLARLPELVPGLTVVGETETTLFEEACMTKDAGEIAALKAVAERSNRVMGDTIAFIKGYHTRDGVLIKDDGQPLTVGDVKRFVRGRLYDFNLENDGEMIFAIGRDAGVPHSRGADGDPLALGKAIIFDLFPRDLDTGYLHDMTRTFCLGFAPPEVAEAYDQVGHIFHDLMEMLAPGVRCAALQDRTCDFFRQHGHQNIRDNTQATEGYVHGLGHGVGFEIHERPGMYSYSKDVIQPNMVITLEPGLYYPDRSFGVRIEDTILINEKGEAHSLTPTPKDLVIPMEKNQ